MILIVLLFIYVIPIYAMEYTDAQIPLYSVSYNVPYKEQHNTELVSACSETKKALFLFHNNKAITIFDANTGKKTKTITKHIPQASDWICSQYCRCYMDWEPRIWDMFYPTAATYDDSNNLLCVAKQRGHEYALLAFTIKGSHAKNSYIAPQITKFSGHTNYVTEMALTSDGLVTTATDKMIKIWDMPSAMCSNTIIMPESAEKIVPFTNNSLLSMIDRGYSSKRSYRSHISQWDTRNNQCTDQFSTDTSVKALSVFSEYNFLSAEHLHTCEYDPETYMLTHEQSDSFVNSWDTRTGTVSSCYTIPNRKNHNDYIAALTHYKHYIVALTSYGFLHIWDTSSSSNQPYQSTKLLSKNHYLAPTLTKLNDDSLLILGKKNIIKLALTH